MHFGLIEIGCASSRHIAEHNRQHSYPDFATEATFNGTMSVSLSFGPLFEDYQNEHFVNARIRHILDDMLFPSVLFLISEEVYNQNVTASIIILKYEGKIFFLLIPPEWH